MAPGTWEVLGVQLWEELKKSLSLARLSGWEERAKDLGWYPGTVATEAILS